MGIARGRPGQGQDQGAAGQASAARPGRKQSPGFPVPFGSGARPARRVARYSHAGALTWVVRSQATSFFERHGAGGERGHVPVIDPPVLVHVRGGVGRLLRLGGQGQSEGIEDVHFAIPIDVPGEGGSRTAVGFGSLQQERGGVVETNVCC